MTINFFQTPSRWDGFSLVDGVNKRVNPALLDGSIILVGPRGGTGLADNYPVPTSVTGRSKMDSVEIWANTVQQLATGRFIISQNVTPDIWPGDWSEPTS